MIDIRGLRRDFPGFAFGPVSLHVEAGSFFAIMGPTGSGKTLLLESLAGLIKPQQGKIFLNGKDITKAPPEQRGMGLVYQDNALFPHMTVLENITYGQRYHGIEAAAGKRHALELAEMLRITPLLERKPAGLSGGEKQRTAIARALACRPDVVLLDEPLSSLDPQFREGLRKNLKELHRATQTIFFMVTHDFTDALTLAEQAAVIHNGRVEQAGAIADIFRKPATTFIARFVGMENIFPASFTDGQCRFAGLTLPLRPGSPTPGSRGDAALRPEDIAVGLNGEAPAGWITLPGEVSAIDRRGFAWTASVHCAQADFITSLEHRLVLEGQVREGTRVRVFFNPASVHYMTTPEQAPAASGS